MLSIYCPSGRWEDIGTVDADGVALAGIQGLHRMVKERDVALSRQQAEIDALRAELAAIRSVLATIAEGRSTQTAVVGP